MDKVSVTALGFSTLMLLLVVAFGLDAYSQLHSAGVYVVPPYLIEFCKLALQFAFGATAFAGLREIRRVSNAKKSSDSSPSLPPGRDDSGTR